MQLKSLFSYGLLGEIIELVGHPDLHINCESSSTECLAVFTSWNQFRNWWLLSSI